MRADRNLYSKTLIEREDEVAELKRRFKYASHTITQLKEEIQSKDIAFTSEHIELEKMQKEKDTAQANLE